MAIQSYKAGRYAQRAEDLDDEKKQTEDEKQKQDLTNEEDDKHLIDDDKEDKNLVDEDDEDKHLEDDDEENIDKEKKLNDEDDDDKQLEDDDEDKHLEENDDQKPDSRKAKLARARERKRCAGLLNLKKEAARIGVRFNASRAIKDGISLNRAKSAVLKIASRNQDAVQAISCAYSQDTGFQKSPMQQTQRRNKNLSMWKQVRAKQQKNNSNAPDCVSNHQFHKNSKGIDKWHIHNMKAHIQAPTSSVMISLFRARKLS